MGLREPLVVPVGALAIGIALQHFFALDHSPLLLFTIVLFALATLALVLRSTRAGALACIAGFVTAGTLLEAVHAPPPPPRLNVPDLDVTILSGCVVEPPALTGDKEQFVLEIGRHARARISLFTHAGDTPPNLRYGERVEAEGRLRAPRNFGNPQAFDYRNYLARQDVFWTLSANRVQKLNGTCGNPFDAAVHSLRTAALDRIADLYRGDRYNVGMMDAVLIGESSGLDRIWTEQYRSTGTFHALIISGSHVAVITGTFLFLLRILFVPRVAATFLTLGAAWLYALVTGWQAPVIRSAAGMTLFALGSLFFRDRRLLNLLAAVALFFLVLDPDQLFDPSFQLSFLAVSFLAVFAVPIIEATSEPVARALRDLGDRARDVYLPPRVAGWRVELRLLSRTVQLAFRVSEPVSRTIVTAAAGTFIFFYDLMVTSAVVQAGLALPMALYFHRVSLTGLSANTVVVPLLGLVVPIGFVALFTGFHWIAGLAALLLDASRRTVEFHARYEPNWRIPSPPIWLSVLICVALIAAAIRWRSQWMRWLAATGVAASLALMIVHPFAPALRAGDLELTAVDVGQGDSLFLAFPDGKTMLMDAGGIPAFAHRAHQSVNAKMDIGEDVVAPYLWTRSIRRLDVVAISHLHDDHIGGLPAILNDFSVRELWVGATPQCSVWTAIQAQCKARGIAIRHLHRGDAVSFGDANIAVLAPSPDYQPLPEPKNDDSLVLRLAYRRRSFLLTGDMERPVESEVANSGGWPHADVLKVGHHGSKTSSTPEFLDQVHPALAIISDGYGNLYGHPHPNTLSELQMRHILAYRTDRDGLISVFTDGERVWRE